MPNKKNNNGVRSETREIETLTFRAAFQPATFDAEKRTVEIVWTTGAKGLRRGWDGEYYEELEVSKKAIRLGRLNNGAPLLAAHDAYSLRGVVGVVERAWIAKGEGRAIVRFSERPEAAEIARDVQAGILQNISVGYAVHRYERVRSVGSDGKPDGGIDTLRAVDWEPMEVSIVPIGFDDGAKVRSSDTNKKNKVTIIQRDQKMSDQTDDQIDNNETDDAVGPSTPVARAAVRAERRRVDTILRLADSEPHLGLHSFAAELARSGVSVAEARRAFVDEMAEQQRRTQPNTRSQHFEFGTDYESPEFRTRAMSEALAHRINPANKASDAARPFLGRSIVEIARECLHGRGVSTRTMRPAEVVERSLGGMHGTSDFAILLGDSVNRELLRAFEDSDPGVLRAGRPVVKDDFKPHYPVKLGDFPRLTVTNEHGEFKYTTLTEASEPAWSLKTRGGIFALSRQAMVNDDLSSFSALPAKLGQAAREEENLLVVDLLLANSGAGPTMGDGQPLFHSTHLNLAGSGTALSVTSLGAARAALRLQKNLAGKAINVVPKFLIVPVALETTADQLLATITPTKTSEVNPFSGTLKKIVDPRLDASSTTRWYLAGDPGRYDGLQYAHLAGREGPYIETKVGFNTDGVAFKVVHDFGTGFVEYRSWYANPGA